MLWPFALQESDNEITKRDSFAEFCHPASLVWLLREPSATRHLACYSHCKTAWHSPHVHLVRQDTRLKAPIRAMNSRNLLNHHGSTLTESLVAISLFGLASAAIGDLLTSAIQLERTNGTTTTAVCLAASELEDLHAQDYDAIASHSLTKIVGGAIYNVQTTVITDSPETSMKSVTTKVTWIEARGPKSYLLDTIYINPRIE